MIKGDEEKAIKSFNIPVETLKKISEDTEHNIFLTDSELTAVNFDKVVEKYCKDNHIFKYPMSNDALYLFDEKWYFIEFKNGEIVDVNKGKNTTVSEIREKIQSSLNLLFSIADSAIFRRCFPFFQGNVAYTVNNMSYILVYNDLKNRKPTSADRDSWIQQVNRGEYDSELEYLERNYINLLDQKKQKSYEKLNESGREKAKHYVVNTISNSTFLSLISDIRSKMNQQDNDEAFDDFADMIFQEAQLPIMRFGLDKYKDSIFSEVYTYTGDYKSENGEYEHGEFYNFFIKKFKALEGK